MTVDAEAYLTAFDRWLTRHIGAATKAGKDFAFCERNITCAAQLDEDGSAWDYALLEPGSPSPGLAWTVYRLHGAPLPSPTSALTTPVVIQRRSSVADLVKTLFGPSRMAEPQVEQRQMH